MRAWARPSWEWSYIWAIVVLALPSVALWWALLAILIPRTGAASPTRR